MAASEATGASTWVCGTSASSCLRGMPVLPGASSCLRGMPVLPGASSWVYGTEVASVVLVAATKSVLIQDFLRTKLHQKNNGCQ